MVMASGRWLGVRLDLLISMLIGAVSLAAVLVSQDAGRCICKVIKIGQKNDTKSEDLALRHHACLILNRADQYILFFILLFIYYSHGGVSQGLAKDYHFGLN